MTIDRFCREHVAEAARLHCAGLTGLLSRLGLPAARAFYSGCVMSGSAHALVALDGGALLGHVLGSVHPDRLSGDVLRANPFGVLAGVGYGAVRHPSVLPWLVKHRRGPHEGSYDRAGAELTYLAVAPDSRGRGIGRDLVDAFTEAMREAGVSAYELSVDDDNRAAISLYERMAFEPVGRYREFGIMHRRYRLSLRIEGERTR